MHSSLSAQHASPCKSMSDDVSSVSQLFDMQRAFLCKSVSTALDTEQESAIKAQVRRGRTENPHLMHLIWTRSLLWHLLSLISPSPRRWDRL